MVRIAAHMRARASLSEPSFSTRAIITANFPGTIVCGGSLPEGVDEIVRRMPEGPVIVYARGLSTPAQRFAIAHAMGHLFYDGVRESCRIGHAGELLAEWRADMFAAELLAPLDALGAMVTRRPSNDPREHELYLDHVDGIASKFAVPPEVIDSRIRLLLAS